MGEVYAARDTRLDRRIAIKVLAPDYAVDAAHLARFAREAKAASSLNHPNIVGVFDVGEEGTVSFVAMELVEGRTLADLLHVGPLSSRRLLDLACQLADGLAAAHEAGIVHRDLKPSNVMVTREGFVKILDFGLARAEREQLPVDSTMITETEPATRTGEIVGTAGYMSPEQARGEPVDFRSDQFSFGSVVYEMATGRRAFRGNTRIDTLAAVLNAEPEPITRFAPAVPAPLRWAVERCHGKVATDRYQSTRDLARELRAIRDHLSEVSSGGSMPEEPPARKRRLRLLAIGAAALAAGAGLWALMAHPRSSRAELDYRRLTFRNGVVTRALFMQRSNSILYTASWDGQAPRTYLTLAESKGTDRSLDAETQLPMAFSEDGSEVLVLLGRSRPAINSFGTLAWWPALGGRPRPFLENAGWADWAKKGRFAVVVQDEGETRAVQVRDRSGTIQRTLFRSPGAMSYVALSPDETEVAFIHHPSRTDDAGEVRIASVDGRSERRLTPVFERCIGLRWNPRTREIWFTASRADIYSTSLWTVTRNGEQRLVQSFPELFMLQDISEAGTLFLGASEDTTMVLQRQQSAPTDFSWLGSTFVADVSPDGQSVLFLDGSPTAGTLGAWVRSVDGGEATRITDGDPGKFSPDGKWVVGTSRVVSGTPQLILVPAGGGEARTLTSSARAAHTEPSFLGADWIVFNRAEGEKREVWRIKTDGTGAAPLGISDCGNPMADPAGKRLLCFSRPEVNTLVVYPIGGPAAASGVRPLYTAPQRAMLVYARWNADGDRIFAVTGDRRFLTLDASNGKPIAERQVPVREGIAGESLLGAACSPDGVTQAYSIGFGSSRLYLGRNVS
jgi:serine/threonine protein kinase